MPTLRLPYSAAATEPVRHTAGCWATEDIEAIADNYPVFGITYETEDTQVMPEDD